MRLEMDGLVRIILNVGTFVEEVGFKQLKDVFEIRSHFVRLVYNLAAERISTKEVVEIRYSRKTMLAISAICLCLFCENASILDKMPILGQAPRDMHRAIQSLVEDLEAVGWYDQRIDVCQDRELKAILEHNRDEEKEHAAMVMEWIRRKDPIFDEQLKNYLFTDKPVAH